MEHQRSRSKIGIILFSSVCVYGFYLRLMTRHNSELWNDEIYQFNSMKGDFKPFWLHQNYGDHTTFPGEYILNYPFVHIFGPNKWGLAIPHILITILGFWLLFKVCGQYLKSWAGWIVTALAFSLNQTLILHSLEFRPYGVLPVMALAALFFSRRLIEQPESISKFWVAVLFIFIINYHVYGITIFILPLMFVILSRKSGANIPWKFLLFTLGVGLPVWYWYASYNHLGFYANTAAQALQDVFQFIPNPVTHGVGFIKGVVGNLVGDKKFYILLFGVLLNIVYPHKQRSQQILFFILLIILPIVLILYFDWRSQYWFLQRQFIWVMPFFSLLMGWSWDNIYIYLIKKSSFK